MASQKARANAGTGEAADENASRVSHEFAGEHDWDEYDDEIASARAFAAWQEASASEGHWGTDEANCEPERLDVKVYGETREDWSAVDEVEDDVAYQWSEEEEY